VYNAVQNSRIEIILGVIRNLLDDIANLIESSSTLRLVNTLNVRREISRDFRYLSSRTDHEGIEFLTISMPILGKWYDKLLVHDNGELAVGFKPYFHYKEGTLQFSCPLFCRMLAYVLNDPDGSVPEQARVIRAYRSLFYLVYKLERPLSEDQLRVALDKWKENEEELDLLDFPSYFSSDAIQLRELILELIGHDLDTFVRIRPRHGPGAVAGGEDSMGKWETIDHIPSLHRVYPRYETYFGLRSGGRVSPSMCGEILSVVKRSKRKEAISRLLFVPKDSRGPRTISCEPKELMFIQQGVSRNLMRLLEVNSHGRINFVDQSINGRLALTSSENGEFATIDLQDASDRVTTRLVDLIFPEGSLKYLHALRSHSTLLPDGTLYEGHRKYAPMGSALCFPIESACFWALAVLSGIKAGLTCADAKASTYVYGDDIIIRPQVFSHLCETFISFGLKVNTDKSYVEGPFRESCGVDAWKGENVTPFKIKKDISRRSLDGNLATAVCEYSSSCYALNYRMTGGYLLDLANSNYPGILVHWDRLGGLSVIDPLSELDLSKHRWGYDRRLCHLWVMGWVLSTPKIPCRLEGLSRLLYNLYGYWEEHDPSQVADSRTAKIRKRKILVE